MYRRNALSGALIAVVVVIIVVAAVAGFVLLSPGASPQTTTTTSTSSSLQTTTSSSGGNTGVSTSSSSKTTSTTSVTVSGPPASLVEGASFTISAYQIIPLVAIDQGYYRQQNLNVTYVPSSGSGNLLSLMLAGKVDIGWLGLSTGVLADENQGAQVRFISMPYQKYPVGVYALNGQNVTTPKDLVGKSVASNPGSEETLLFPGYLRCVGVDPASVTVVGVAPAVKYSQVSKMPVIGFLTDLPTVRAQADAAGRKIQTILNYSDCLQGMYGNGVATTQQYLSNNPDVVRRFMIAFDKAIEFAYLYPNETASIAAKYYPALGGAAMASNAESVKIFTSQLAQSSDVSQNGWGWMTEPNWNKSISLVNRYLNASSTIPAATIFTNQFQPHILPTNTTIVSPPSSVSTTSSHAGLGASAMQVLLMAAAVSSIVYTTFWTASISSLRRYGIGLSPLRR